MTTTRCNAVERLAFKRPPGYTHGALQRGEPSEIVDAVAYWAWQAELEALENSRPCDQCSDCKRGQECPNAFT